MNGKALVVLYDSGASHSFISHSCVSALQFPISKLPNDLLVSTPTNKPIKTSQICKNASLRIEGRIFVGNLIYLPLFGLNIILGMDWLSANRVMLSWSDKTIVFSPVLSLESATPINLYLSSLVVNYCGKESQGYVLLSTNVAEVDQKLNDIPIVREYPDVFPKITPEFPLGREIEFTIELVLGMGLISIAPYRMSPLELAKLKKKIKELLEKKFIRPSASPWGAPVLLVKKKDGGMRLCIDYR